jgi:hypothetical protein
MLFRIFINENKEITVEGDVCLFNPDSDNYIIYKKETFVTNNGDIKESFNPKAMIPQGFIIIVENE